MKLERLQGCLPITVEATYSSIGILLLLEPPEDHNRLSFSSMNELVDSRPGIFGSVSDFSPPGSIPACTEYMQRSASVWLWLRSEGEACPGPVIHFSVLCSKSCCCWLCHRAAFASCTSYRIYTSRKVYDRTSVLFCRCFVIVSELKYLLVAQTRTEYRNCLCSNQSWMLCCHSPFWATFSCPALPRIGKCMV
jgi:hypothetical protein